MPVMFIGGAAAGPTILEIIQARSLTTGLILCLDAGDALSYETGQKWLDRSGGGYDFFRGADGTSESPDPTFNGNAGDGSQNEYFSLDSDDRFTYDTSVETWMSNLHKDGATYSFIAGVYLPASGTCYLFSTADASNHDGVDVTVNAGASKLNISVRNAAGTARSTTSTATPDGDAWNFVGFSINEATPTGVVKVNETTDTGLGPSYTSPSTNAAQAMWLGELHNGLNSSSGARLAFLAMWTTTLTSTNLDDLYADIKAARAYGF